MLLSSGFCEQRPKLKKRLDVSVTGNESWIRGENCFRSDDSPKSSWLAIRAASARTSRLSGCEQYSHVHDGSADIWTTRVPVPDSLGTRTRTFWNASGFSHTSRAVVPLVGSSGSAKKRPPARP